MIGISLCISRVNGKKNEFEGGFDKKKERGSINSIGWDHLKNVHCTCT